MKKDICKKIHKSVRLIAAISLLGFVISAPALADGFFSPLDELNFSQPKSIYLDSSQIVQPFINLNEAPSPSEYAQKKKQTNSIFSPDTPLSEVPKQNIEENTADKPYFPTDDSEEIPTLPVVENNNQTTAAENLPETASGKEEPAYTAAVAEFDETENVDLEGKIIQGITFNGLRLISENQAYSYIPGLNGTPYNETILQKALQDIYSSGYFTDAMHVEPSLNDDDTVSLEFFVQENIEVKNVSIVGNTVYSETELLQYVKPLKNKPQNLNLVNEAIEKINNLYHDNGYILAGVTSVDDDSEGNLTLGITEGIIDKIVFDGNKKTQDFVIRRNILTQPGSVYNEEVFKKDLTRIHATQIFDEVDRSIDPSPDKEGEYIVTVKVKEASSNSISIGAGIDTALGLFGSASVSERNFLGRGQEIGLSGIIGSGVLLSDASVKNRMNYQVELHFNEPYFINEYNSLLSKVYYKDLGSFQVPLAVERRFGVNGTVVHKVKGNDNLTTSLGVGFEHIGLSEGDFGKISALYAQRRMNIALREKQLVGGSFFNFTPGVKYSTLDDEFMPREGTVAKANFVESLAVDDIRNTTGRLMGSITKYIPVFKKSTLSIGTKAGIKVHGDHMPEVMSFGLGGPYNIRGYRMNGVGTGDSFLMGSTELQTPIPFMDRFKYDILKNMRFAFFVDAGRVFDPTITSKLYDRPLSAIALGVGLRINIPGMGPISIDYGLPVTHVGAYGSKKGYVTFGTAGMFDGY